MDMILTCVEARVLGCLVEKELATPEYYPLSLNALVNACNQKSNREPVMSLAETEVVAALERLRPAGLVLHSAESVRVAKYGHNLRGKLQLRDEELAVLCELLLRGPQTAGELRGRGERMYPFAQVAEVESVLQRLMQHAPPLITRLVRQPGRKEPRYAHLLAGVPAELDLGSSLLPESASPPDQRIERLEDELRTLRADFEAFKAEMRASRTP
jgi:uncharacterized protein YceH (UPF0502 family)